MEKMFGWEGEGLQRGTAGSGWMVGIGVTRMGKSLMSTEMLLVCSNLLMDSGILGIVPLIPFLSSVPILQTGDLEIM